MKCAYCDEPAWTTENEVAVCKLHVEKCCEWHRRPNCCDPNDCGPCCPDCPTCPTLIKQRNPLESAEPQADRQ